MRPGEIEARLREATLILDARLRRAVRTGRDGGVEDGWFDLELLLDRDRIPGPGARRVLFRGVRDLRFPEFGSGQVVSLAVEDVRERQWDGVNFRVFDAEDKAEGLRFLCRDIRLDEGLPEGP